MTAFNIWLYNTGFSQWVRESGSLLAYPAFLFLHSIGLGILVGLSWAFALRILGVARQLPIAPFENLFPLLWMGFGINAVSGVVLYAADAVNKWANPLFYVKLTLVALAVANLALIKSKIFRDPYRKGDFLPLSAKVLAAASLVLWAGVITAGRLMAYWKETAQ
jgi:hypothetical protein